MTKASKTKRERSATRRAAIKKGATKKGAAKKGAATKSVAKKAVTKSSAPKKGKAKSAPMVSAARKAEKRSVLRKAAPRKNAASRSIDDYIARFPADVQAKLQQVRATIRQAAPDAKEVISYQMPAFTQQGNVIYFAGYEHHIGLYPAPRGIEQFKKELAAYEGGKGTIKLPHDRPLPLDLIRRIVEFKVQLNLEKAMAKRPRR